MVSVQYTRKTVPNEAIYTNISFKFSELIDKLIELSI